MLRLLLCGVFSWLILASAPLRADEAEDKAVAHIEKLGGAVVHDESRPGKPVIEVQLNRCQVTNTDLRALAPLQNLTRLHLRGATIKNADLKELNPFLKLNYLDLSYT